MAFERKQLYYAAAVLAVIWLVYYWYNNYRVLSCASDADCPSDYGVCANGLCVKRTGVLCGTAADCASGQICVGGLCTAQ